MTIDLNTQKTFILQLYDPYNNLINSTDITVEIQSLQLPGYMTYTKFITDTEHEPLTISNNTEVDENGIMNIKFIYYKTLFFFKKNEKKFH